MTFSVKDFFSKCEYIRSFLRILPNLPKKSLTENFISLQLLFGNVNNKCARSIVKVHLVYF